MNRFVETADSPLVGTKATASRRILVVDEAAEREQLETPRRVARGARRRRGHRAARRAARARARHRQPHGRDDHAAPAAGGTVGEWAGALREVFGEYRAPTGVGGVHAPGTVMAAGPRAASGRRRDASGTRCASSWASPASTATPTAPSRSRSPRRDAGMEVVYQGIRLTPEQIAAAAAGRRRRPRRPLGAVGLAPPARARDGAAPAGRGRDRAGGRRRDHPRGRPPGAARGRRGARLHAEGLPPRRHRRRARRPRRRDRRAGAGRIAGLGRDRRAPGRPPPSPTRRARSAPPHRVPRPRRAAAGSHSA